MASYLGLLFLILFRSAIYFVIDNLVFLNVIITRIMQRCFLNLVLRCYAYDAILLAERHAPVLYLQLPSDLPQKKAKQFQTKMVYVAQKRTKSLTFEYRFTSSPERLRLTSLQ